GWEGWASAGTGERTPSRGSVGSADRQGDLLHDDVGTGLDRPVGAGELIGALRAGVEVQHRPERARRDLAVELDDDVAAAAFGNGNVADDRSWRPVGVLVDGDEAGGAVDRDRLDGQLRAVTGLIRGIETAGDGGSC